MSYKLEKINYKYDLLTSFVGYFSYTPIKSYPIRDTRRRSYIILSNKAPTRMIPSRGVNNFKGLKEFKKRCRQVAHTSLSNLPRHINKVQYRALVLDRLKDNI